MGFVFISYSSKDVEIANQLNALLTKNNIKPWMAPNDIPTGFKYAEVITYAIKECSCLVLLLTSNAQNSNWVPREVERSINYGKKVLPIQLENIELNEEFQLYISVNHLLSVKKIDEQSAEIQKLLDSIKKEVEAPQQPELNVRYRVGDIIDGKYEVLRIIDENDSDAVLFTCNKTSNQQWTVKVVYKNLSSFEKYGKSLSMEFANLNKQLDHPTIPKIVDIIDNDDNYMVVMDYIEGETLSDIIQTYGAQSEKTVLEYAIQIADALQYLHRRTPCVFHIDMRPDRWILKPDGSLKINGFIQLQKVSADSTNGSPSRTRAFIAPEEYDSGNIDPRIDIYSLGVLLYSLITGKDFSNPPYVMLPIRANNPELSKGMEYIVLKCLEPNPKNRYQSVSELLKDLTNIDKLNHKLENPSLLSKLFPFAKRK